MKLSIVMLFAFLGFLTPKASIAQQSTPVLTVKNLFILLDKPDDLIKKEANCYAKMEGYDILELNKPFIKRYLAHLKNTGLFSSTYLAEENKYYLNLQKDILTDGSSEGRDNDLYTMSQDPFPNKMYINALQKMTPLISGNKATLTFRFKNAPDYKLVYRLVKENKLWVIDKISSM